MTEQQAISAFVADRLAVAFPDTVFVASHDGRAINTEPSYQDIGTLIAESPATTVDNHDGTFTHYFGCLSDPRIVNLPPSEVVTLEPPPIRTGRKS